MTGLEIKHKREFRPWRWILLIILMLVVAATGWYAYRWYTTGQEPPLIPIASADPRIDESDIPQSKIDNYTVPSTHPRYISIPSLGIHTARVLEVGVTADKQLDMPNNINDTAWYPKSSTPGRGFGSVLIDGRNGSVTKNGVFSKLSLLKIGDKIIVERGDGKKFTYGVKSNQSMPLAEVNATGMKMMMQSVDSDNEGLSLMTYDGKWIPRFQQFDRRIMLRAALVE